MKKSSLSFSGLPGYVAHTPSKTNLQWHLLVDHTLAVAETARESAIALGHGAEPIAYYLGILHDLGKFTPKFQNYLWQNYLADQKQAPRPPKGSAPHKQYGAMAAWLLDNNLGRLWQLPLQGHHGGMKSRDATGSDICRVLGADTFDRLEAPTRALLDVAAQTDPRLAATLPDVTAFLPSPVAREPEARELFVRLLFSCLVDADARDTEAHGSPDKAARRTDTLPDFAALLQTLQTDQQKFTGATGAVADVRREVYDACQTIGRTTNDGFYTLTVPTGGGKTRSSLAFALHQAVAFDKRRIVYGIPYTSIIDQTADVFRTVFGGDTGVVLEHHSAVGGTERSGGDAEQDRTDDAEAWRLLAAEDWNAPIVVTTTVQLFESLFARTPAACRKLHRLAGSVLILDEVQCLPVHLLAPIRSALKTLVEHFGVTVVLCTATQPAHETASKWMQGITATPIVPNPAPHFAALRRVTWHVPNEKWGFPRLASELRAKPDVSTLCVLNTRKQAQDVIAALQADGAEDGSILHLSTLLCPAHRRTVIAEVKERVKSAKNPVILVSTQVIEAGVDLSFARMFRAMGPLERMIQAAGRCNREGEWGERGGEAVIFTPENEATPKGWYERCLQTTKNLLLRGETDFDDPSFVTSYFAQMYNNLEAQADTEKIGDARRKLQYDYVAEHFRMIDSDTVNVFVTEYEPKDNPDAPAKLLDTIKKRGKMTRELWRAAQGFTVSLPIYAVNDANAPEVVPGLRVWADDYDPLMGVPLNGGAKDGINPSDLYLLG